MRGCCAVRLALILAVIAVRPFSPAFAYYETESGGVIGGVAHMQNCPPAQVLVGVAGLMDAERVIAIQPICAAVDANGNWTAASLQGQQIGGRPSSANKTFDIRCPAREVVAGIRGNAVSGVSGLRILCSEMRSGRLVDAPPQDRQGAGGTTGTAWGPFACPNAEPAQGFRAGADSTEVVWVGLVCNLPTNLAPDDLIHASVAIATPITVGSLTSVTVSIRNMSPVGFTISWRLDVDGKMLTERTDRLLGNFTSTFAVPWTARGGNHRFVVQVDPTNALSEPAHARVNNTSTFDARLPITHCSPGMTIALTPSGERCVNTSDAESCSALQIGVPPVRVAFSCETNNDCAPRHVCSTDPCLGVCLRDH